MVATSTSSDVRQVIANKYLVERVVAMFMTMDGVDAMAQREFLHMLKFEREAMLRLVTACFMIWSPEGSDEAAINPEGLIKALEEHFASELSATDP